MLSNFDFENNIYDTEENSHVEFLGNDDAEGSEFKFINMSFFFSFSLGFTPCKAEQPLQDMELQEKETQKD